MQTFQQIPIQTPITFELNRATAMTRYLKVHGTLFTDKHGKLNFLFADFYCNYPIQTTITVELNRAAAMTRYLKVQRMLFTDKHGKLNVLLAVKHYILMF